MKPLAIDLFCGLGGWTEGLLAEGYDVIGFDIERHEYGKHKYPAQLVIQDVLTIHGSQFKSADLIVASPPCQEYSYMAMPWTRAKKIAAEYRNGVRNVADLTRLFDACFRIQREACEAAGRHIPLVVENVKGAQPWVGRSRWNFGSFHLWGDVPALMPMTKPMRKVKMAGWYHPSDPRHVKGQGFNTLADRATKNAGGSWFNIGSPGQTEVGHNPVHGIAVAEREREREHKTRRLVVSRVPEGSRPEELRQQEQGAENGIGNDREDSLGAIEAHCSRLLADGYKGFNGEASGRGNLGKHRISRTTGSKLRERKFASAMIAKIPLPLSRHIARIYRP